MLRVDLKLALASVIIFFQSWVALGGIGSYFKDYRLGVNLIGSGKQIEVKYNRLDGNASGDNCRIVESGETECRVTVGGGGGPGVGAEYLSGFGLFIQQPFKRQGTFYFRFDISFAFQTFAGEYDRTDGKENFDDRLDQLAFELYGIQAKPYVKLGWTPQSFFPDILLSIGPIFQVVAGNSSINEQKKDIGIAQGTNPLSIAFLEFELVFLRFGQAGAFSFYVSNTTTGNAGSFGEFYPGEIDGMDNFRATFATGESGLKLLLNLP